MEQAEKGDVSLNRLNLLVCGDFNRADQENAWGVLMDCVENCEKVATKLTREKQMGGCKAPTMASIGQDGVTFKKEYGELYKRAIDHYLYATCEKKLRTSS